MVKVSISNESISKETSLGANLERATGVTHRPLKAMWRLPKPLQRAKHEKHFKRGATASGFCRQEAVRFHFERWHLLRVKWHSKLH